MMTPLKEPAFSKPLRLNENQRVAFRIPMLFLACLFAVAAMVNEAWAIDLNRGTTNRVAVAKSPQAVPDLDQLARDLEKFLGGARAAAVQRGAGQKVSVNSAKAPGTNPQPTWRVTAADNGTARQIKLVGKPPVSSPVPAKSKRTEAETTQMVQSFLSSQSTALKLTDPNAELTLVSSDWFSRAANF